MQALRRRWRSVSFRSGLVAGVVVGIVATLAILILLVLGFAVIAVASDVAQEAFVERAEDQLMLGVIPPDLDLPLDIGDGSDATFWVVIEAGEIVQSDGPVDPVVLDAELLEVGRGPDFGTSTAADREVEGIKEVGGREWLYLERDVTVPDGTSYTVVSAVGGDFTLRGFIRGSLLGTVPVVIALAAVAMFVTSFLTRRALRRVERMRAEVELITQQSLDRRVPIADADDDIDRLAHTMNDMLRRLEESTAQQNRFLADASHELRSPVTGLVAQLDVAAAYPDRADPATLIPRLQDEARRLQDLIDDLLYLSRAEIERSSPTDVVDVDALLAAERDRHELRSPGVVEITGRSGGRVNATGRDIERALGNLTDNAVRHCTTRVLLSSAMTDSEVVVTVADDGPGIPADQIDRIFDRFVRLDEARSRDAGGSGLGLAIAREVARSHGGDLTVDADTTGGATFRLTLPRSSTARPPVG